MVLNIASAITIGYLYYLFSTLSYEPKLHFLESVSTVGLTLIGYSLYVTPNRVASRILILNVCITGAVAFWSYNAGLVSVLTVETFEYPIQSLQVSPIQ